LRLQFSRGLYTILLCFIYDKKMIASILIVLVIASVGLAAYTIAKPFDGSIKSNGNGKSVSGVNSFDSCIAAGFPVQETAPPRCMDSKGNTFVDKYPTMLGN